MDPISPRGHLKKWFENKWATSDRWLPWFLGIAAVMVLIVGFTVGILRSHTRAPANVIEISDSEVPASEVYSEETVESLTKKAHAVGKRAIRHDRGGAGMNQPFVVILKTQPTNADVYARTGVLPARARAVVITSDHLTNRVAGKEQDLRVELFPDVAPTFRLKVLSGYEVNQGMHSGTAADDPGSRLNITTADGSVSAFITYRGKDYRIVPDPERGVHYVIEVGKD